MGHLPGNRCGCKEQRLLPGRDGWGKAGAMGVRGGGRWGDFRAGCQIRIRSGD